MQKIFYDTLKYKKMNDGIFNFYAYTVNISLQGFYAPVKIIYMGLEFL